MANPYVTIPEGPDWMQRAWYNQYLQSASQPQQPEWWEQLLGGLTAGVLPATKILNDNWQMQASLDQRTLEQDRAQQQQLMLQQNSMDYQWQKMMEADKIQRQRAEALHRQKGEALVQFAQGMTTPIETPQFPVDQAIPFSPDRAERAQSDYGSIDQGVISGPIETSGKVPFEPYLPANTPAGGSSLFTGREAFKPAPDALPEVGGVTSEPAATVSVPRPSLQRMPTPAEVIRGMSPPLAGIAMTQLDDYSKLFGGRMAKASTPKEQLDLMEVQYWQDVAAGRNTPQQDAMALRAGWDKTKPVVEKPAPQTPLEREFAALSTEGKITLLQTLGADHPLRQTELGRAIDPTLAGAWGSSLARLTGQRAGAAQDARADMVTVGPEERSNWIKPETLEQAPEGLTRDQLRRAGYVSIDNKRLDALDALRATTPLAERIRSQFDPAIIGPAMGRFNTVLEMFNAAPEKFAGLRATTEKYRADAARAQAGSAIGPAEREVFFATYPTVDMSPQQFMATFGMVETGLRIARNRILGTAPATPEVPVGQEVTLGGRKVIIDKANPDGSLSVHDPLTGQRNVWRP